ncbi:hypothetical protein ACSVC9_09260 [Clostridium sp. LBM24168]
MMQADIVCIRNIDSLIYRYFKQYCNENRLDLSINSNNSDITNIFAKSIAEVGKFYDDIKIIDQKNLTFIMEEVFWIKSCNYLEIEEYQNADRVGRMSGNKSEGLHKLQKNSRTRSAIFKVLEMYNYYIRAKHKVDFSRIQLEFIKYMSNNKDYSSYTY